MLMSDVGLLSGNLWTELHVCDPGERRGDGVWRGKLRATGTGQFRGHSHPDSYCRSARYCISRLTIWCHNLSSSVF